MPSCQETGPAVRLDLSNSGGKLYNAVRQTYERLSIQYLIPTSSWSSLNAGRQFLDPLLLKRCNLGLLNPGLGEETDVDSSLAASTFFCFSDLKLFIIGLKSLVYLATYGVILLLPLERTS